MEKGKIVVSDSPVYHVVIDDFLVEEVRNEVFDHVLSLREHFVGGAVGEDERREARFRTSAICDIDSLYSDTEPALPQGGAWDWARVKAFRSKSPLLREFDNFLESDLMSSILQSAPYPLSRTTRLTNWKTQVSRYGNDGQFFTWHRDTLSFERRPVTLIYYMHSEPKRFSGGQICLTNSILHGRDILGHGAITEIEPKNNRLLIFGARTVHSVRSTRSPPEFSDGRFSVNIWAGGPLAEPSGLL